MSSSKQRIDYLDSARGLAILAVVLGHSFSGNNGWATVSFVYSFHVMFFFIVSGALYAHSTQQIHHQPLKLLRKLQTLLLPYVVWGVLLVVYYSALGALGGASFVQELSERMVALLHFTNGAMWFLLAMFIAQLLFFVLRKNNIVLAVSGVGSMACVVLLRNVNIPYIGILFQGMVGFSFVAIGYLGYSLFFKKTKWWIVLIVFAAALPLIYVNGTVSTAGLSFGNPFLYVVNACTMSWLLIQLCMRFSSASFMRLPLKIINSWGKYSIIILCLHFAVIESIRVVDHKFFAEKLPTLGDAEGYVITLLTMAILTMTMPIFVKLFGWSFGIKKNRLLQK